VRVALETIYALGTYNFEYVTMVRLNQKARDRLNIEYNTAINPTVFLDGGYQIDIGLSTIPSYQSMIVNTGARVTPPVDLITTMIWHDITDVELRVRVGNNVSVSTQPQLAVINSGPTTGVETVVYDFEALAVDAEDDALEYQWAWGDDDTTGWLGPYGAGLNGVASHAWADSGSYQITVRTRDAWNEMSEWSTPRSMSIGGCCVGESVGNMDSDPTPPVDMGDLTILIDMLFLSLTPIGCLAEADVDLSGAGTPVNIDVDMGDLTVLIDHLFLTLSSLPSCP